MRKSFSSVVGLAGGAASGQLKLRVFLIVLLLLNAAAFYFYFDPPGGSQQELAAQDQQINNQIAAMKSQESRLQRMASRVETGSSQIVTFQKQYFLPKRIAYGSVIEEIQRMATLSGLQERDAGFAEEPIEGTSDLSLLNIKANYEGPYASLVRFLYEADKSPMLLMLDSVTAAPEQRNGQIIADIRFQAIIQDRPVDEQSKTGLAGASDAGTDKNGDSNQAQTTEIEERPLGSRPLGANPTESKTAHILGMKR